MGHVSVGLRRRLARQLTETSGHLRAEFGYGTVTETAKLFCSVAVTCVQKRVARVLIIAGDDDPAHERSLRDALRTMVLAGISSDFELALVTAAPRVAHAYRNFQSDVTAAGIAIRLFDTEGDAMRWLDDAGCNTNESPFQAG
jgi:hypothetical protein